jgi:hypothetical protein
MIHGTLGLPRLLSKYCAASGALTNARTHFRQPSAATTKHRSLLASTSRRSAARPSLPGYPCTPGGRDYQQPCSDYPYPCFDYPYPYSDCPYPYSDYPYPYSDCPHRLSRAPIATGVPLPAWRVCGRAPARERACACVRGLGAGLLHGAWCAWHGVAWRARGMRARAPRPPWPARALCTCSGAPSARMTVCVYDSVCVRVRVRSRARATKGADHPNEGYS